MPRGVSKSKRFESPSISSDRLEDVSVSEESSGRKRTVSASSNGSENEISQASPTKRYKAALPGSPEYDALRPVTVTGRGTAKSIGRKLSFGSVDNEASVHDLGRADSNELALGEEKRSRKPSKKALESEQAKKAVSRSSLTKISTTKGRSNARPPTPIVITSDDDDKPAYRKPAPVVKIEHVSDDDLLSVGALSPTKISTTKGRSNAQPSTPIEISSDDSDDFQVKARAAGSDDETPKPARKAGKSPIKSSGRHRVSSISAASDDLLSAVPSQATMDIEVDTSLPPISTFTIHPSDSMKGPAYAPKDLRDPETDKPIFLLPQGFNMIFEPPTLDSLDAAAGFKQCIPFVNPAKISPDELLIGDYKHIIWPGSKQNAIFTMLGAVNSCDIIHPTSIGAHKYRAVTIIPHGPSFAGFTTFLERMYGCSDMFGPFEFGCLLTFSSRREGLSSAYGSSSHVSVAKTRRNMKVFGSSANAPPAALWFEKQFPPFIDFHQDIPIYDASSSSFMFAKEDFVGLPSLPLFKKAGDPKFADLPPNALVTVFFAMNTYISTRAPPTPGSFKTPMASGSSSQSNFNTFGTPVKGSSARADDAFRSGSSTTQVLSPNLQFLIYHGMIPDDD